MDRQPRIPTMTIKDMNDYVRTLWDWVCLDGCFGVSKIMPSDIDGFVERNGRFLVIETKSPGTELLPGQARAYTELAKLPQFTVLVVWGTPGIVSELEVWGEEDRRKATLDTLRWYVSMWYSEASGTA